MTVVELSRRLISLIYAGRNRKVMIRRELPRTKGAGWTRGSYRIEFRRILLFVCPSTVISAALRWIALIGFLSAAVRRHACISFSRTSVKTELGSDRVPAGDGMRGLRVADLR